MWIYSFFIFFSFSYGIIIMYVLVFFSTDSKKLSTSALIDFFLLGILTWIVHEFHCSDEWVFILSASVRPALFFTRKPKCSSATFKVITAESALLSAKYLTWGCRVKRGDLSMKCLRAQRLGLWCRWVMPCVYSLYIMYIWPTQLPLLGLAGEPFSISHFGSERSPVLFASFILLFHIWSTFASVLCVIMHWQLVCGTGDMLKLYCQVVIDDRFLKWVI